MFRHQRVVFLSLVILITSTSTKTRKAEDDPLRWQNGAELKTYTNYVDDIFFSLRMLKVYTPKPRS